jgi:antitoxin (DNA-binding transcriptional repressor) of toxin-antitoxin stability system
MDMSEEPVTVSTDGLESWNDAVHRAEHGETVAVVAHGRHVADVVPSGELARLRETIDVLSDSDLMQDIRDGLADLHAGRVVPAADIAAELRSRSTR